MVSMRQAYCISAELTKQVTTIATITPLVCAPHSPVVEIEQSRNFLLGLLQSALMVSQRQLDFQTQF